MFTRPVALLVPLLLLCAACDKAEEAPTTAPEGDAAAAPSTGVAPKTTSADASSTSSDAGSTTGGDPTDTTANPSGGEVIAEGGRLVWANMNGEQRREHMAKVVLPGMKTHFKAHDADEFAKFGCDTCHGKNGKDVGFELPNDLTPLDPADPIGSGNAMDPETTKFMAEIVVPEMAKMLDTQPYDPKTGKGFGCFDCHLKG